MPVQTLTAIPRELIAGDTVIVKLSNSSYPATLWTLDVALRRNGSSLKNVRATATETTKFLVTFSTADTAGLVPGPAEVAYVYTEIASGQRATKAAGPILIRPNPTGALAETEKQIALREAKSHLLYISRTPGMVGANQTQMVLRSIEKQRQEVDRLQAEVWKEQRDAGIRARGGMTANSLL